MGSAERARDYRRSHAVWLVAQGRPVVEVAQLIQTPSRSIYRWVENYLETQVVAALGQRAGGGRPPTATRIPKAGVLRELQRDPLRLGYNTTLWTVPLLTTRLRQVYDCPISERTLRRRLKEIGLVWKRPRYVFATKDPHRAQKKGRLLDG